MLKEGDTMKKTINFDMDGTLADFYAQMGWLEDLKAYKTKPYRNAKPMVNMRALSHKLNRLQKLGYEINIISWLSKCSNSEYDLKVEKTKRNWLNKHLSSVKFNNIYILKYGTPKENYSNNAAILFR
jgi:hypothetical protein